MSPIERRPGLPPAARLTEYRIWDSYFTPSHSHPGADGYQRLFADVERSLAAIRSGRFEKLCYFAHVGTGTTSDRDFEAFIRAHSEVVLKPLERWPKLLIGMIQLNANDVRASLDAINRWLRDGPMLGVYFPGSGPGSLTCTHRNFNPIVQRIAELRGVIMQHTWFKTGGKQSPGESTPSELAELAARFPQQKFLCATRAANGNLAYAQFAIRQTFWLKPPASTPRRDSWRWRSANWVHIESYLAVICRHVRWEPS